MTTRAEKRIEALENRLGTRRTWWNDPDLKARVEAMFAEPWTPRDDTDPNAYNAEDYTDAKINSCPARRRCAEVFGIPRWDGKRWQRVDWPENRVAPYFTPLP